MHQPMEVIRILPILEPLSCIFFSFFFFKQNKNLYQNCEKKLVRAWVYSRFYLPVVFCCGEKKNKFLENYNPPSLFFFVFALPPFILYRSLQSEKVKSYVKTCVSPISLSSFIYAADLWMHSTN